MSTKSTASIVWKVKPFHELELEELYKIIQLREEVFILEQQCIYTDLDFADQTCTHVMGFVDNEMVAYARIFGPVVESNKKASFGRVLVAQKARRLNIGKALIEQLLQSIKEIFQTEEITISAQSYLLKFYNSFGFKEQGEIYLDAGVPHITMHK